jgi:hypothetical protein
MSVGATRPVVTIIGRVVCPKHVGASDCLEKSHGIPKQQEQSVEDRIGSMIEKIIVLALIVFFVWALRLRWLQSWEYSDFFVPLAA